MFDCFFFVLCCDFIGEVVFWDVNIFLVFSLDDDFLNNFCRVFQILVDFFDDIEYVELNLLCVVVYVKFVLVLFVKFILL